MSSSPPPDPAPAPGVGAAPPPVEVVGSGWTVDGDGALHPTVVLDVGGRPDVADLPRVHASEGVGDLTTALRRDDAAVLLQVRMTSPVRAAFSMRLLLPEHRDVLDAAAIANRLVLATTEPGLGDEPLWLAIDLDGHRLAELLG